MELPFDLKRTGFREKSLFITKIAIAVFFLAFALIQLSDLMLLLFAAVMVGVFFRGIADFIARHTPLSAKWSLLIVILLISTGSYFSFKLMAPAVAEQLDQLSGAIPKATQDMKSWLLQYQWGRQILEDGSINGFSQERAMGIFTRATGALSTLAHIIGMSFVVLFIGIYLAWSPETYRSGFLHLIPIHRRKRLSEVMGRIGFTLRWWLIGRFIDMAFVGLLVWVGLYFLDVPLALILALIAAVLNFIPNIGPFLGAIPAILVGLGQGPDTAMYIAVLFFIIQSLESGLVTPMVQQKVIHMPPALTLSVQIILGAAFGTLGIFLATPIAAALIVATKHLYVRDVLGDKSLDV